MPEWEEFHAEEEERPDEKEHGGECGWNKRGWSKRGDVEVSFIYRVFCSMRLMPVSYPNRFG